MDETEPVPTDYPVDAVYDASAFAAREAIAAGLWDRHLWVLSDVIRARMKTPEWLHPTRIDPR